MLRKPKPVTSQWTERVAEYSLELPHNEFDMPITFVVFYVKHLRLPLLGCFKSAKYAGEWEYWFTSGGYHYKPVEVEAWMPVAQRKELRIPHD